MDRVKLFSVMLLASAVLAGTPAAIAAQNAQEPPDPPVDVAEIAGAVLFLAPDEQTALAAILEIPPLDDDLPLGFVTAEYVAPDDPAAPDPTRPQQGLLPLGELDGVQSSVAYAVEGDADVLAGEISANTLTYVFIDPFVHTDDTLDEIEEGIVEGFAADDDEAETDVTTELVDDDADDADDDEEEDTLVAGTEARLVTYRLDEGSPESVAHLYILPVGNVYIFSLVTIGAENPIDAVATDGARESAEDLALAGIKHLATAVTAITTVP